MSQQFYDEGQTGTAAETYERYFVPAIGRPVAEDLIEAATLRKGERVLDVAQAVQSTASVCHQPSSFSGSTSVPRRCPWPSRT